MFPWFQEIPVLFPFLLSLPVVIFLPLAKFEVAPSSLFSWLLQYGLVTSV